MILARWRLRRANRFLIDQIHGEIVAASRAPALYREFGVADTLEGRFEMVVLHAALTVRRLLALGPPAGEMAQELVDAVFRGFEDAFREMAIGDAGVARRLKTMAADFGGRARAYGAALDAGDHGALGAALGRNVYGSPEAPEAGALAERFAASAAALEAIPYEDFAAGRFRFPLAAEETR
jgi:cytochrome b pre-mRNA-processing protein 3